MGSATLDADVLVIGGGLAGLCAAARLHAGGASVLVLEARDRLGGRTHTRAFAGAAFDFGGQFIGPGQPLMYELVRSLGLKTAPTHVAGRKVLDLGGRVTTYAGTLPFVNPLKLFALHLGLKRIDRLCAGISSESPWSARDAAALDGTSLADWLDAARAGGGDVRGLTEAVVRTVFGAEPAELSLLHFLWYVSASGGLMPLVETRGGFQHERIVGGTQQISERIGAALGGGRVRLGAEVRALHQDAGAVTAAAGAASWRARRAIVAVPLSLAGRIAYEPPLPPGRRELHQGVAMGSTVKVLAAYQRPFWRERGLCGQAVGTGGTLTVTFDNTTPDGAVPCLLGFAVGGAARALAAAPPELRRAQVLDGFARLFGPEARTPLDYAEMDWGAERFSGGCPTGNFAPGTLARAGSALRAPAGRIHWAGTEIARRCVGYMEGALDSGDRAAEEVLGAL